MYKIKIRPALFSALVLTLGLMFSGCYTQFSRPDVDTDQYYDYEDEDYAEEYYEDEDVVETEYVNYYDVYVGGPPIYYGPHVWMYWSPYYRYTRHHMYYDPWWNGYRDVWHVGIYDPFWDPWYDSYYNRHFHYYHPRNHYYWGYDRGRGYESVRPQKKRDFDRRGAVAKRPSGRRGAEPSNDSITNDTRRRRPTRDSGLISKPNQPTRRSSVTKNRTSGSTDKSPDVRKPKSTTKSSRAQKPKRSRVTKPTRKQKPSSSSAKRSTSTRRSKPSSYSKPSSSSSSSSSRSSSVGSSSRSSSGSKSSSSGSRSSSGSKKRKN